MLGIKVKPLEAKLTDVEKMRVDTEKVGDKAISSKRIMERNLAKVELVKKVAKNEHNSLLQKNTDITAELNQA